MFTPQLGSTRWSGFFGAYVTLVRYVNDDKWYFTLVLPSHTLTKAAYALPDLKGIYRAQTAWSQMPIKAGE